MANSGTASCRILGRDRTISKACIQKKKNACRCESALILTFNKRLVVADDVRMSHLLAYDGKFTDDCSDTLLTFLRCLTPRRIHSVDL